MILKYKLNLNKLILTFFDLIQTSITSNYFLFITYNFLININFLATNKGKDDALLILS